MCVCLKACAHSPAFRERGGAGCDKEDVQVTVKSMSAFDEILARR